MTSWNLFLDDERYLRDVTWMPWQIQEKYRNEHWVIARNKAQVLDAIYTSGMPSFISFDHDLGDDEATGYDITKVLVDLDMGTQCLDEHGGDFRFPDNFDFCVHSKNPIGKENIIAYLEGYFKNRGIE